MNVISKISQKNKIIILHVLFLISFKQVFSQKYAPIEHLKYYGVLTDNLPGEYKSSITVNFNFNSETKLLLVNPKKNKSKINENNISIELNKTTVVFLKIFIKNKPIDTIFVGTYIFNKNSNLPIVSLHLKREDFDNPGGILTGELLTVDSLPVRIGRVWKKQSIPVFMEYFENSKFNYGGAFRIKPFGGMTLGLPEKSMRIYADSTIGPKKIYFSPFMNKKYESYKSFVIRTSGNDQFYTRIKDMMISSIAKDLKIDYLDYRPSVIYINGEYWGIYNLREKCNLEYLNYNHNAKKNKETILLELDGRNSKEYNAMVSYVGKKFPINSAVDSINKKIILENYIDYIILQIHIQNTDSRGNVRFWKSKSLDNLWRWIFFDSDLSCAKSQANFNYLEKRLSIEQTDWYNPKWATILLRNLISHKEIKNLFINEYCLLLGTKLHVDTLKNRVDFFSNIIRPEIPNHVLRRNLTNRQSSKSWENQINDFKTFFKLRNETAPQHLKKCFNIKGNLSSLKISSNIKGINVIRLKNTVYLFNYAEANFFNDIPVQFEATDLNPKYKFINWQEFKSENNSFCTVYTSKTKEINAIYERKKYSELHNKIICNYVHYKSNKKNDFYIIGLTNISNNNLNEIDLNLRSMEKKESYNIKINNFNIQETKYLTNNFEKAKKLVGKEKFILIDSSFYFRPKENELVILDKLDNIIDTIFITKIDTIKKLKKGMSYFRNYENGNWSSKREKNVEKINQNIILKNKTNKIPYIISILLFIIIIYLIIKRRKLKQLLVVFLIFSKISYSQNNIKDRFGLDSVQTKLIDNKGLGFDSLYGCRNVRVVLKNLIYRGGNNNPISVQNPLTLNTINDLKLLNFNKIIYLYNRNFDKYFPQERLDSLKKSGIDYECSPTIDSTSTYSFLSYVHSRANLENPSLTFIHCWNGWHQSGWLSSLTLIQFCDYSNDLALKYWTLNTDGNHKGYKKVYKGILEFKPYKNLTFTKNQKIKYCPCMENKKTESDVKKLNVNNDKTNYYIVKKNESLNKIADINRTNVETINKLNKFKKSHKPKVGDKIRIN